MTSGVEKSSDKRKRERSGDERYIEAKGSEAVVDGDRCKKKMYKEEREKDRGKEVRKEERKEGRGRTKQKKRSETRCVPVCERNGVQKPKLQDVQLQARLDERRDCQRRQQKALSLPSPFFSSWISSNSSKRLTRPVALSLSFTLLLPEALARSFQWSRKRISRRFHHEIFSFVHKWYDCAAMQLLKCHFQRKINVFYLLPISYFQCLFSK